MFNLTGSLKNEGNCVPSLFDFVDGLSFHCHLLELLCVWRVEFIWFKLAVIC